MLLERGDMRSSIVTVAGVPDRPEIVRAVKIASMSSRSCSKLDRERIGVVNLRFLEPGGKEGDYI